MAVALVLAGAGLVAGCFATGPVYLPTGAECGGETPEDAAVCEGGICLGFVGDNVQHMTGFCSSDCASDADCTPHDHCVAIQGQPSYCMRACQTDDDCYDAFVCRLPSPGAPFRICLVDPL